MPDTDDFDRALEAAWAEQAEPLPEHEARERLRDIHERGADAASGPLGPGIRCGSCDALPDEQHDENCPERDPGPVWPGSGSD